MISAPPPSAGQRMYKILLVDDVELFLELEMTFFRRENFRILTATNGDDVLRLAREEKPDLVFLDLCLSGVNGDEVCRRLKSDPETAHIPVIMLVQSGNEADIAVSKAACCDDILYKPVQREDFLRAGREQLSLVERRASRTDVRLLVSYGLRDERLFQQYTVNVGTGGFFLATAAYLSIDTRLNLQLELPDDGPPVCCSGRVAWLNHPDWIKKPQLPHGMGVEFIDITAEQRQRIIDILT